MFKTDPRNKNRKRIPDTIKSVIETYRVAGAMTDPYGSYTGNNLFAEVEADNQTVIEDAAGKKYDRGVPVQDADDL